MEFLLNITARYELGEVVVWIEVTTEGTLLSLS